MVSAISNGGTINADMVKRSRRITRGDITTVLTGAQVMVKARFKLDPSTNPGGVNCVNLEGAHARKSQLGIFERRGDLLTICLAPPKKPRPFDFSSTSGDGRALTTWRREKA